MLENVEQLTQSESKSTYTYDLGVKQNNSKRFSFIINTSPDSTLVIANMAIFQFYISHLFNYFLIKVYNQLIYFI